MRMRPLLQILLLVVIIIGVEVGFYLFYRQAATGYLADSIAAHTATLESGIIPPADEINFDTDAWVRVAHFESAFYRTLFLVDTLVSLLIAWVLLRGGVSASITRWAEALSRNVHLARGLYLIAYSALFALISIPTQISGYLIESLRGTGVPPFEVLTSGFLQDLGIGIVFALLTFIPFYWIIDRFPRGWWALGAAFMSIFSVFTAFIEPLILEPLYLDLDPLPDTALALRIESLADRAGVPVEDVYVSDTDNATLESNAFVTGLGTSKRVVLDDTMLRFYTDDEIVAVVAHELGHYALQHLWYDVLVVTIETFVSFYLLSKVLMWSLRRFGSAFGARRINDVTLYPLIGAFFVVFGFITAPMDSAFSRFLEHQADAYELHLAGNPQASADSLKKAAYQSFVDPDPSPLEQWWFGTHPSMRERIEFFESNR